MKKELYKEICKIKKYYFHKKLCVHISITIFAHIIIIIVHKQYIFRRSQSKCPQIFDHVTFFLGRKRKK